MNEKNKMKKNKLKNTEQINHIARDVIMQIKYWRPRRVHLYLIIYIIGAVVITTLL